MEWKSIHIYIYLDTENQINSTIYNSIWYHINYGIEKLNLYWLINVILYLCHWRIFHPYRDVTIAGEHGERLDMFGFCPAVSVFQQDRTKVYFRRTALFSHFLQQAIYSNLDPHGLWLLYGFKRGKPGLGKFIIHRLENKNKNLHFHTRRKMSGGSWVYGSEFFL